MTPISIWPCWADASSEDGGHVDAAECQPSIRIQRWQSCLSWNRLRKGKASFRDFTCPLLSSIVTYCFNIDTLQYRPLPHTTRSGSDLCRNGQCCGWFVLKQCKKTGSRWLVFLSIPTSWHSKWTAIFLYSYLLMNINLAVLYCLLTCGSRIFIMTVWQNLEF